MAEEDTYQISRRKFLATGTCGSMGIASAVNVLTQLQLMNAATASISPDIVGSDYKALVCIFLRGGCDMNNVLIPVTGNPYAESYMADRQAVAVPNGISDPLYNPTGVNNTIGLNGTADPVGLHPDMPNLAAMFNGGEAAFLTNVGTLGEHTTPGTYGTSNLPKQLFSHSDQVTEWMSSIADRAYTSGWGARVAELYHDTWNPQSETSMLITASGNNQFLNGSNTSPQYSVTSTGAISLAGFGTNYSNALNTDGSYTTSNTGRRLKALERMMAYSHAHILEDGYATVVQRARENEAVVTEASQQAAEVGLDLDTIFANYNAAGNIADELKAIARLIAGRKCLGNKRQIFFVDLGGFDNHQDINTSLGGLLTELDTAVGAFNQSLKDLAALDSDFSYDQVTTFQASDFNRTWTPNSENTATAGTDHAWGTHSFLFGGAVNGGQLYGAFPELAIGGAVDVPSGSRGRWIPTTSVDQYSAVLAKWFGVPENSTEMEAILPNLGRFNDPFSTSAQLGML